MRTISILIGLAVLLYGRQLFWLFVAGVGFALGMTLAGQFPTGAPHWQVLLVALAIGLVGAWCAVVFERLAVAVAGFLVGAAIAIGVMQLTGAGSGGAPIWMGAVAGGILGALVVAALFDWALIVLSSAVGAALVTDAIGANPSSALVLFALLLLFGLITQARRFKGGTRAVGRL